MTRNPKQDLEQSGSKGEEIELYARISFSFFAIAWLGTLTPTSTYTLTGPRRAYDSPGTDSNCSKTETGTATPTSAQTAGKAESLAESETSTRNSTPSD